VLHAAWFASKRRSILPLTRAAALGDTKDDLRELAFVAAPYAAGLLTAAVLGWSAWTAYEWYDMRGQNAQLQAQLQQLEGSLAQEKAAVAALPYEAARVRNVMDVASALDAGKVDMVPALAGIAAALESDAVVLSLDFVNGGGVRSNTRRPTAPAAAAPAGGKPAEYTVEVELKLASVITKADEAVQTARRIERRLKANFDKGFTVTMTKEPVGAQAAASLSGGFGGSEVAESGVPFQESFHAAFRIEKAAAQ